MATKKSSSARKKPTAKTTKRKAPAKRASKRTAHLRLQPESEAFMTFRINRETLYWIVLGVVVIAFTAWILKLQSDVMAAYDRIDANAATIDDLQVKAKDKEKNN